MEKTERGRRYGDKQSEEGEMGDKQSEEGEMGDKQSEEGEMGDKQSKEGEMGDKQSEEGEVEINRARKERWRGRGAIWALREVHVQVKKRKAGGCKVNW